ncbi:MAG: 30S ribosomal protein S17 [Verrucomicrobiales bacterium]|nr:30S ribosomal protein S17 [Verrucomicrobiales bacterium]
MSETKEKAAQRKERTGQVVSDKAAKTIVVRVERRIRHPLYKKIVRRFNKFHAHDEKGLARVGDWVRIRECRPISKLKCWRLVEVIGAVQKQTATPAGE